MIFCSSWTSASVMLGLFKCSVRWSSAFIPLRTSNTQISSNSKTQCPGGGGTYPTFRLTAVCLASPMAAHFLAIAASRHNPKKSAKEQLSVSDWVAWCWPAMYALSPKLAPCCSTSISTYLRLSGSSLSFLVFSCSALSSLSARMKCCPPRMMYSFAVIIAGRWWGDVRSHLLHQVHSPVLSSPFTVACMRTVAGMRLCNL